MLAAWTEILPMFIVRWLALRICERFIISREDNVRIVAMARPDVLIRLPERSQPKKETP